MSSKSSDHAASRDHPATVARLLNLLLERGLGTVAGITLLAMMILTMIDVFGRYLFNAPVPGGFEITEFMLASLVFLGLPLTTASEDHVTVDLLDGIMPNVVKFWQSALVNLIGSAVLAVMSWKLWQRAFQTLEYGDTTATLQIPYPPLVFLMAIMSCVATVVMAGLCGRAIRRALCRGTTRKS